MKNYDEINWEAIDEALLEIRKEMAKEALERIEAYFKKRGIKYE